MVRAGGVLVMLRYELWYVLAKCVHFGGCSAYEDGLDLATWKTRVASWQAMPDAK